MTKADEASIKKHIRTFWKLFGGGLLLLILLFLLASWGVFGSLPDISEYENPEKDLATQVISEDGKVIGKFFKENRTPVDFEDLPDHLVNALIATEDIRFYDHAGVDGRGTIRAFAFLGTRGGASTITQQLAKQFFTDRVSRNKFQRGVQKIKEWIIASQLERRYTKEEIITMYFNVYDFLNLAIGIESAAQIYFDKAPQDLNVEESAMLVGMFKNSSLYNPLRNPEGVTNRRNVVLSQMAKYEYISEAQRDSLKQLELGVKYSPQKHIDGIATYVREYIRGYMKTWARENPKANGEFYNIDSDGLKVYTSINSKMQQYAEQAVDEHMPNLQKEFERQNQKNKIAPFRDVTPDEIDRIMKAAMRRSDRWREMEKQGKPEDSIIASFKIPTQMNIFTWAGEKDTLMTPMDSIRYYKSFLRASLMSVEPQTGSIKAWVGGINYKHFKYDMVKTGKRQIGSTFKPFVYATAIDQMHMSPCDTLPNTPYCIAEGKYGIIEEWCPKNSDGEYGGFMSLKKALAGSVNTITARLIDRVGPIPVIELANKVGVNTEKMPVVPSIALGTPDLSLYEMVGAYSTFANEGVFVLPNIVQRIEDKNGTVLYQYVPETKDVISTETAYVTVSLMQGVTEEGSGTRLRHTYAAANRVYKSSVTGYPYQFDNPIAGKTGTTQNQSDGWFMGMVPNLATGVWVGGEDRSTHFSSVAYGQGATMALPIWALYMRKCYDDEGLSVSKEEFKEPEVITIETDCEAFKENNKEQEIEIEDDELEF